MFVIDFAYKSSISAIIPRAIKFIITSIVVVNEQMRQILINSVNKAAVNYMVAIRSGDNVSLNNRGLLLTYLIIVIDY